MFFERILKFFIFMTAGTPAGCHCTALIAVNADSQNELSYHEIYQFFKSIFQSKKTANSPVLADIQKEISEYNVTIPLTDINICGN